MWQAGDAQTPSMRTRRPVAELFPRQQSYILNYLCNQDSIELGFTGVTPFSVESRLHDYNVMEVLAKRLPNRKRGDFTDFLAKFRLPSDFSGSDFALLGYTGGRLPSDRLDFAPDFSHIATPIDLFLEVVGSRYYLRGEKILQFMKEGDPLRLEVQKNNEHDENAVAVFFEDKQIGYINRGISAWLYVWLEKGRSVCAQVSRFNGTLDRPIVYLICSFGADKL